MQNYDSLFLDIFVPLIVVQIPKEADHYTKITSPFKAFGLENNTWDNSILKNRLLNTKFKTDIKIGNDNTLLNELTQYKEEDKHSRLSPFNADSDLFPNGILSNNWFRKYRTVKPFTFIQVLELPQDSSEDEALASKINDIRNAYGLFGIRYVCIITSDSPDAQQDDARVTRVRQLTGLTRLTGVLYINYKEENLEKQADVMVTGLLSNLKNVAIEFYKGIDTKLKQRTRKYYTIPSSISVDTTVELTPKFLETRNLIKQAIMQQFIYPHNLESSIRLFELSYQNLVQILQDNFFEFTKDNISDHDFKLYTQIRMLIDVVAFHIVRSYLSLEDPVTALKKHSAHVLNVTSATKGKIVLNQWMSIQYEWLAELLSIIPKSILATANIKTYNNKHKNHKAIQYFGGIRFDDGNGDVTLNPGLIYLISESFLETGTISDYNQLDYLKVYKDEKEVNEKKLNLLENAVNTLESMDENSSHTAVYKYICFHLANAYFDVEQYLKALKMYQVSASGINNWAAIKETLYKRLKTCYIKVGNYDAALTTTLSIKDDTEELFEIESLSDIIPFEENFFEIDTLFTSTLNCQKGLSDVYVFDSLTLQAHIKPRFDPKVFKSYFKDSVKCTLVIKEIEFQYDIVDKKGSKVLKYLTIKHNSGTEDDMLQVSNDQGANLTFYLNEICNQFKVIEIQLVAEKSGLYKFTNVVLNGELSIKGSKTVELDIRDEFDIQNTTSHGVYDWYYRKIENKLSKVPMARVPSLMKSLNVMPIKPIINVNYKSQEIKSIVLGEKVCLNFDVAIKNQRKVNYSKISLSPRAKVVSESEEEVAIEPKLNWDNLKDDEASILEDLEDTLDRPMQLKLSIHSTSLQAEKRIKKSTDSYKVIIELKAIVEEEGAGTEDSDSLSVYDVFNLIIQVVNTPFVCKFSISPKYREEGFDDIPSPFILPVNEKVLSMPIVTRVWQGNLVLADQVVQAENHTPQLDIISIDYNIKPNTKDILLDLLELSKTAKQQLFTTKSKSSVPHRNVTIVASAKVEWKRQGSDTVNMFDTDDWEIVLPLADPRVLLQIEDMMENRVKLEYIIENPTPRIFTFSGKLVDENERFVWNFDSSNMFPLTQPKFHVLPFNRYILEYYCTYNSADDIIQLPQLKVFDIQYKVSLPTLPVSNDINIKDNNTLYWRVK